jgi:hypothetical protein
MPTPLKPRRVCNFIGWMLRLEAQRMTSDLHYAPMQVPVIELIQKRAE